MKNKMAFFFTLLILGYFANFSLAQGISSKGVKAGVNFASVHAEDTVGEIRTIAGLAISGFLTYSVNNIFALQPEVMYTKKGYSEVIEGTTTSKITESLNYLEIPLLCIFSLSDKVNLFVGPSISFFTSGQTELELSRLKGMTYLGSDTEDIKSSDIISPDYSAILGGSFSSGKLVIDIRYSMGLKSIYPKIDMSDLSYDLNTNVDVDFDYKNRVIQLMLGYCF
ncbi:MAG: PorT family protein [Tissierellales bacterium]|nr:PorT family protein [Tissierellales bacterium]